MGQSASRFPARPETELPPEARSTELPPTPASPERNVSPERPQRRAGAKRMSTLIGKLTPRRAGSGAAAADGVGVSDATGDRRSSRVRASTAPAFDNAAENKQRGIKQLFKRRTWAPGTNETASSPYRRAPAAEGESRMNERDRPPPVGMNGAIRPSSISLETEAALASTDSQPSLASSSSSSHTAPPDFPLPNLTKLPDVPNGSSATTPLRMTAQREIAMDHLAAERAAIRRRIAMLTGAGAADSARSPDSPSLSSRPPSISSTALPTSQGPLEEDPGTMLQGASGGLRDEPEPMDVPDPKDLVDSADSGPSRLQNAGARSSYPSQGDAGDDSMDMDIPEELWNRIFNALNRGDDRRLGGRLGPRSSSSSTPVLRPSTPALPPIITPAPPPILSPIVTAAREATPAAVPPPTPPPVLPPPLPIIPAGTTMIIQGIVQAAEDIASSRDGESGTASLRSGTSGSATASASATTSDQSNRASSTEATSLSAPSASRSAALLSGTFGDPPSLENVASTSASTPGQNSDGSSSAAELLGALLTAAASATANMLLSDPPTSGASPTTSVGAGTSAPPWLSPASAETRPAPSLSVPVQTQPATASPTVASSVGTGPRPRPYTMYAPGGIGSQARDRNRPRSLMGTMRDRILGGPTIPSIGDEDLSTEDVQPRRAGDASRPDTLGNGGDAARDPIETLRERIASELMRALSQRDGNGEDDDAVSAMAGPPAGSSRASVSTVNPVPPPSPRPLDRSSLLDALLPPEGSFQRFLHDTNVDLRATLNERTNFRREQRAAVTLPVSAAPSQEVGGQNSPPAADSTRPAEGTASTNVPRIVHRAPEGLIEPRLNWWRMHRFPSRIVAAPEGSLPTSPSSPTSPTSPTSSSTPIWPPRINALASASLPPTANIAPQPQPGNSMTLVPVIVVGIRTAPTVLARDIATMTLSPAQPATSSTGSTVTSAAPETSPEPGPSSPASPISAPSTPSANTADEGRTSFGRAIDVVSRAMTRRRLEREAERERIRQRIADLEARIGRLGRVVSNAAAEVDQAARILGSATGDTTAAGTAVTVDENRNGTRNYLIWVIGGYYPETHPILVSPNLLLNHFDHDDLWGLAELLGQVKPPVASKEDIDRAGLEIIKTEVLKQYESDGKVTSNTTERCLICLSEYEPEEELRILSCKHVFHQECVDKWLEVGRNNCPACRTKGVEVTDASTNADASASSFAIN